MDNPIQVDLGRIAQDLQIRRVQVESVVQLLDEGNTVAIRRQIQTAIMSSLQTYETRIAVDNVEVETVAGAPSQIHVQIFYRLLRTNTPQQIGVTMQGG